MVSVEEADSRSEELLAAVADHGQTGVFWRDGIPVVEMTPWRATLASPPSSFTVLPGVKIPHGPHLNVSLSSLPFSPSYEHHRRPPLCQN